MVKKIFSYIITLILVLLLIATIMVTVINQTLLKKDFMIGILVKNNYYKEVYDIIKDNFINNTVQSGLEESVLDGIITEEEVRNDVNSLVAYMYNEGELSVDKEIVKNRLKENIDEVIKENNKRVTSEEQHSIGLYLDTIANLYEEGITYSTKYVSSIRSAIQKVEGLLKKAMLAGFIAIVVVMIILFAINRKKALKYIAISMMGVGLLSIIPKIIEATSMQIHNILFLNLAFSHLIIAIIESVVTYFLVIGILLFILGFAVNIISSKIQTDE